MREPVELRRLLNLAVLAWLAALPAWSADFLAVGSPFKESASLPAGQKAKNLYAAASILSLDGPIQGDLCAIAGQIHLSAPVERNVEVFCGGMDLENRVAGNVRLAAGRAKLDSPLGGDLVALAGQLEITSRASVRGDAVLAGRDITVAGPVGGRAWIAGTRVRLDAPIRGKTVVRYDQSLVLGKACRLPGKLECYGPRPPETPVGFPASNLDYHPAEGLATKVSSLSRWTAVFGLPALLRLAIWLLSAWLLSRLFPQALAGFLRALQAHPWRNLGAGFLVAAAGLAGIPILFLTLVGSYIALMAGTLFLAALLAARLLAVFYLAFLLRRLLERKREASLPFRWPAGAILVLHLAGGVTWLGWILSAGLSLAALGALAFGSAKSYRGKLKVGL